MICSSGENKTVNHRNRPVVISASRRTDLVSCYPDYLTEKLKEYPPGKVHTVVIWTKNPGNMIKPGPLRDALSKYPQLYIHLTITGLGKSFLEPNIPAWAGIVKMVPDLLEIVKAPERITWRFDPVVFAEAGGMKLSNFNLFPEIAERVTQYGIASCRTSWVEPYRKVTRRMDKKGIRLIPQSLDERLEQAKILELAAGKTGIRMYYCSVDGFQQSGCIDGKLYSTLHPEGLSCSLKKAKGQRKLCGCTESFDIGWYSLKCRNSCLYCYAEPFLE